MRRRICWPDPDAICLEGGCGYCQHEPPRAKADVDRYLAALATAGDPRTEAYRAAWRVGLTTNFHGHAAALGVKR